jgi:hypothetical protein
MRLAGRILVPEPIKAMTGRNRHRGATKQKGRGATKQKGQGGNLLDHVRLST